MSSFFERCLFDALSFHQYLLFTAAVYISRCNIIQGFMISLMVVILYKLGNGFFELLRMKIVIQLNHIFHRAVIAFDFPLRLRMSHPATDGLDIHFTQVIL